ncbi:hemolysin type calcium-binding protein [Novosphingobium kunmingense]|uniref:Hemolysin type calcium-binding protein n=1 Tax=Novosphingobium kunmingense TaxID=1211806 RepID=A0A2N0HKN0_9SPHN|nr:calcium-binding protein [Novosphingobium kunmingense]PKB19459.1 hemolysin type calcium-binding protein [Novosphingobium kunmingense]
MAIAPSTKTDPYILGLEPNVTFTSILTVGDNLPGGGVFAGIPDGLGAFDNGDGTITVLVNHELGASSGLVRDHGLTGAFIDRLVIDKSTLAVVSSDDAIQSVYLWNTATASYVAGTTAFARFCSGDLAETSAYFDVASGLGTLDRIYLTGEESGAEGRAVATIVSGANAGATYELASLGNLSFENLTANPFAQSLTIVAATDDGTNGQVYIYVGEKQTSGTAIEQAGLVGGSFYGIKVAGMTDETNATAVSGTFTLDAIGPNGKVANLTGAQIDAESEAEGVTSFLRPEDSAWDPQNPNVLYFTTTNSFSGNSRLYQATFTDITRPELGGTIRAVLDGSEGQHMFDNLSVADGKVILQEDPGNQSYIARIWEYDIASDTVHAIAGFDPVLFTSGNPGFITQDEESSGIIDVTSLLGTGDERVYLLDAQVHAATGNPATVEKGQLLVMHVADVQDGGNGDDLLNGDGSANTIHGFNGDDTIRGGSGNDTLYGDNGNDRLEGWSGDDVLVGGRGDDVLVGGAGRDQFDFSQVKSVGTDTITDFVRGEDLLLLGEGMGLRSVKTGDFNADGTMDTRVQFTTGGSVILLGVTGFGDSDVFYGAADTSQDFAFLKAMVEQHAIA